MKIITDSDSQCGVIMLAGEIDLCCTPELKDVLRAEASTNSTMLLVDLSEVTFIDSSGLSALIGCWREMQERGGKLVVIGAKGEVLEVFRLTRLDNLISLFSSRAEAQQALHLVA